MTASQEPHWQLPAAASPAPDAASRDWLLEPGSLTARIRARCGASFHLDVIRETTAAPGEIPSAWPGDGSPRLREVTLNCGDTPLIFARTLIPDPATANDDWLLTLGNRPLGDVLFQAGGVREREFEIACLVSGDELFEAAARQCTDLSVNLMRGADSCIWARRSWVNLHGEKLLICECFLPGLI